MASDYRGLVSRAEDELAARFRQIEENALENQRRVLAAFWQARVSDFHFKGSTGYGYDDAGRETLDAVYAACFGVEAALVRPHFVSGTHALGAALFGNLRPGDELLSVCGTPYDTMLALIGTETDSGQGSLRDYHIGYREVPLTEEGHLDTPHVLETIASNTRVLLLQRSRGYSWRPSLHIEEIADFCVAVKARNPKIIIFVDNCYGEFTEAQEPTHVGADLMAGSLIKNPGGGLAPGGAYIVGRSELVARAANRLTMPGLGAKMGSLSSEQLRLFFQGLFLAPHTVSQALKGMHLFAAVLATLGYEVSPAADDPRADIIQAIRVRSAAEIVRFAAAIQSVSPVDAHVTPEPWAMPGYADPVIMAAGAFVQGSSIELSLDAPIREPYTVYLQGGLTYEHVKIALLAVLERLGGEGAG